MHPESVIQTLFCILPFLQTHRLFTGFYRNMVLSHFRHFISPCVLIVKTTHP